MRKAGRGKGKGRETGGEDDCSVKVDLQDKSEEKIGQRIALLQRHVGGESFRQGRTPSPIRELDRARGVWNMGDTGGNARQSEVPVEMGQSTPRSDYSLFPLRWIASRKLSAAVLAASAKSAPLDAYRIPREELRIAPSPFASVPHRTVAATSPP